MADVTLVAEDIRRQRLVMPFTETVKPVRPIIWRTGLGWMVVRRRNG